jgi:hypothetical protein
MTEIINENLVINKCQIPVHIKQEYDRCRNTETTNDLYHQTLLLSTLSPELIGFPLAVFYCLFNKDYTHQRILIVYEDGERERWIDVLRETVGKNARILTDEDTNERLYEKNNLTFVLVPRLNVYQSYPHKEVTKDFQPFVSKEKDVNMAMLGVRVNIQDTRCISLPWAQKKKQTSPEHAIEVHAFAWDILIFTSKTFSHENGVYDLNTLPVIHKRVCISSIINNEDEITFRNVRHILSYSNASITAEMHEALKDEECLDDCIEETCLETLLHYFRVNDQPSTSLENVQVIRKRAKKQRASSSSSSSSSMRATHEDYSPHTYAGEINLYTGLTEFHSTYDFNTPSGACNQVLIDPQSRISALLVYDDNILQGIIDLKRNQSFKRIAALFTDEDYVQLKCSTIIAFAMANLDKPFYLVSPYISFAHPFHNLPNVRCLHVTEKDKIFAIEPEYTLIVFDTFAINRKESLPYKECRCKLLFVTFQHTLEEIELQKFVAKRPISPYRKYMFAEPLLTGDRFDQNTHTVFSLSSAHFTFVDDHSLYSNAYSLLRVIFDTYARHLCALSIKYNARQVELESEKLQKLESHEWIRECTTDLLMSGAELRCIAYRSILNKQHERSRVPRTLLPSTSPRQEKSAILMRISQMNSMKAHLSAMENRLQPAFGAPARRSKKLLARRRIIIEELEGEELKLRECITSFLEKTIDPDLFRIRITCNTNTAIFGSSICKPPNIRLADPSKERSSILYCKYCNCTSKSEKYHTRHLKSKLHKNLYDKRVDSSTNEIIDADADNLSCDYCNAKFAHYQNYQKHLLTKKHQSNVQQTEHRRNKIECEFCSEVFFSIQHEYYVHMKEIHHIQYEKYCPACDSLHPFHEFEDHLSSQEHVEKTEDGPLQTYCPYCFEEFGVFNPGRHHNESIEHIANVPSIIDPTNPFPTIEFSFNRFYLTFAIHHNFINDDLFVDPLMFNRIIDAKEELRHSSDYLTLIFLASCISPVRRQLYSTRDKLSGFLVCSFNDQVGILGTYNHDHLEFQHSLSAFSKVLLKQKTTFHTLP